MATWTDYNALWDQLVADVKVDVGEPTNVYKNEKIDLRTATSMFYIIPKIDDLSDRTIRGSTMEHNAKFDIVSVERNSNLATGIENVIRYAFLVHDDILTDRTINSKCETSYPISMVPDFEPMEGSYHLHWSILTINCRLES